MTHSRLLFGLDLPATVGALDEPRERAQKAEALGFDFVSTNDHVLGGEARYEGWTFLTWIAAATRTIRIASRVIGVPYRHPALLAKMSESLDRLSDGRLILGLGAGSGQPEFEAMGFPPRTLRDRVGDLEEAIGILQGLWTGNETTHGGDAFRTERAQINPPAARDIPLWLGTVGPRGLALVGRRADGWIPSLPYAPPERAGSMISIIRHAADAAGRDPSALDLIYNLEVSFDAGARAQAQRRAQVAGSPSAVTERLIEFLRIGFTGFNFDPIGDREGALETLVEVVMPRVREAADAL
jgi:alkanesulfonate monooxygenase SsuD/methylene tetrahydromethanopterin reductase-like flavin-dependent oxidoreductase (luciferase family)